MNFARRTPLTLAAALLLGVALNLAGSRNERSSSIDAPAPGGGSVATRDARSLAPLSNAESSSAPTPASSTAAAYATAWELLKDGMLPRSERRDLERVLVEEWSQIDLRAALHAAFEESERAPDGGFEYYLFESCFGGVELQPDLAWELAASRECGLLTPQLRSMWINACASARPLDIIRRLPELPSDFIRRAIRAAAGATHYRDDPAPGRDEVTDAVLALRGTPDEATAIKGFVEGISEAMDADELAALMADPPEPALREAYLEAYIRQIRDIKEEGVRTKLEKLSPDLRAEVEEAFKAWHGK